MDGVKTEIKQDQVNESTKRDYKLYALIAASIFSFVLIGALVYFFLENSKSSIEIDGLNEQISSLKQMNALSGERDQDVDVADCDAESCNCESADNCPGFSKIVNKNGFSIEYLEGFDPMPDELDVGMIDQPPFEDRTVLVFQDWQGVSYSGTQQDGPIDFSTSGTMMRISIVEKGALSLLDMSKASLALYKSNQYAYVRTLKEPVSLNFKGKEAYTFTVVNSGIPSIGVDGSNNGGALATEGVIKNLIVDNGENWLVIDYYDTEIFNRIVESFTFNP